MRRDFISSLQRGWIKVRLSPAASYKAVFTDVILSRIFQGDLGEDTVNPTMAFYTHKHDHRHDHTGAPVPVKERQTHGDANG